jgi:hypothetical protein
VSGALADTLPGEAEPDKIDRASAVVRQVLARSLSDWGIAKVNNDDAGAHTDRVP